MILRKPFLFSLLVAALAMGVAWIFIWPTAPGGRTAAEPDIAGGTLSASPQFSLGNDRPANDMFCGPRCVQFILAHYGQNVALVDLIEEIQERDWKKGSSLAAMNSALNKRGIHTRAIQINNDTTLRCSTPIVLHLAAASDDNPGHFVVQLPTAPTDRAALWCGLAGVEHMDHDVLRKTRSGVALLTSTKPIDLPWTSSDTAIPVGWRLGLFLGAVVGVLLSFACSSRSQSLLSVFKRR